MKNQIGELIMSSKIIDIGKVNKEKMNVNNSIKKHYEAVSENGDTLELSDAGKALEQSRTSETIVCTEINYKATI